jgi:hypothetical protein
MTNVANTIAPKSDQLNADDLIGRETMTIKVTKVSLLAGEQPIAINYEGDNGKPFKPCKSMRRVLVQIWGGDGNAYIGRQMTLYRDEKVKFGGADVGGIRISHLSHITEPITIALTASRASRKPYVVKPLKVELERTEPVKSASPVMQATQVSSELAENVEYITTDQAIVIGDMLAKRADLKAQIIRKVGGVAMIPASKYQETVDWLRSKGVE